MILNIPTFFDIIEQIILHKKLKQKEKKTGFGTDSKFAYDRPCKQKGGVALGPLGTLRFFYYL